MGDKRPRIVSSETLARCFKSPRSTSTPVAAADRHWADAFAAGADRGRRSAVVGSVAALSAGSARALAVAGQAPRPNRCGQGIPDGAEFGERHDAAGPPFPASSHGASRFLVALHKDRRARVCGIARAFAQIRLPTANHGATVRDRTNKRRAWARRRAQALGSGRAGC